MQPTKIGRYQIKSELGRGGMATVYLGYDPNSGREIAVKVLPPELLHIDPQFRIRFEREAKFIGQLEHSSIVPLYDVGEENNQPYFVMRYMRGGSLAERIKTGLHNIEETTRIIEQIAPGLDEAHAKGIVHRDLKPSNILFDSKGIPAISDFGIAKLIESQTGITTRGAIIGTPAYMAPEQVSGDPIDGRTDIYALGVILYEMLTGKRPPETNVYMGFPISKPAPDILDVNPNLPLWIETIISKAMARDKNDRFATVGEMVETLKGFLHSDMPSTKKEANKSPFNPLIVIIPLIFIALIGGSIFLQGISTPPITTSTTKILISATATPERIIEATKTLHIPTETEVVEPLTATNSPTPSLPVIGGADKIAFLNNNNIWIMNVDGTDLRSITNDRTEKFNIEWLPDGKTILYITGKTIKTINIETKLEEVITSFGSSEYFESFHVSPDGKQVAISLARELHVVPFDLENFKHIVTKSDLLALNGCIYYRSAEIQAALWSDDGQKLAIKFTAPTSRFLADTIRVIDIHLCKDSTPLRLAEFPGSFFTFSSNIVNFDWDGDLLFFLNNDRRNDGFGELGLYNTSNFLYEPVTPIEGNKCCYRDATFSPDGMFVIFAFQDIHLGAESPIVLYYIPIGLMESNSNFQPIPLPDGFFARRNDAPMPILRPVQK